MKGPTVWYRGVRIAVYPGGPGICPAVRLKGTQCGSLADPERGGFCHVHDPDGKFQQHRRKVRRGKAI